MLIKVDTKSTRSPVKEPAQKIFFKHLEKYGIKRPYRNKSKNDKSTDPNTILTTFTGANCSKIAMILRPEAIKDLKKIHSRYAKF